MEKRILTIVFALCAMFVFQKTSAAVPFIPSTNTGSGAVWYHLTWFSDERQTDLAWIVGDDCKVGVNWNTANPEDDRQLFCFIGNETDGYAVYCKAALAGKTIGGFSFSSDVALHNAVANSDWGWDLTFSPVPTVTGDDLHNRWHFKQFNGETVDGGATKPGYWFVYDDVYGWWKSAGSNLQIASQVTNNGNINFPWVGAVGTKVVKVSEGGEDTGGPVDNTKKYFVKHVESGLYLSSNAGGSYPILQYQLASSIDFRWSFTELTGADAGYYHVATRNNTKFIGQTDNISELWNTKFYNADMWTDDSDVAIKMEQDGSYYKLQVKTRGGTNYIGPDPDPQDGARVYTDHNGGGTLFEIYEVPNVIPLAVNTTFPLNGAVNTTRTKNFVIAFNDYITPTTLNVTIRNTATNQLASNVVATLAATGNAITITHDELTPEATYTVTLAAGSVADYNQDVVFSFTTAKRGVLPRASASTANPIWYYIDHECGGNDGLKPWNVTLSGNEAGRLGIDWAGNKEDTYSQHFCFVGDNNNGYYIYNRMLLAGGVLNDQTLTEDLKLQNMSYTNTEKIGYIKTNPIDDEDLQNKWVFEMGDGVTWVDGGVKAEDRIRIYFKPMPNSFWWKSGGSQLEFLNGSYAPWAGGYGIVCEPVYALPDGLPTVAGGDDPIVSVRYYNLQGQEVSTPVVNNVYIVKKTLKSGKISAGKELRIKN